MNSKELHLELLKKVVTVKCSEESEADLYSAAEQLDQRLTALREGQHAWGRDDILAVTSLNLMDEVIKLKQQMKDQRTRFKKKVENITYKIKAECSKIE